MKVLAIAFTVQREEKPMTLRMTEEICERIRARGGAGTETEIVTMSETAIRPCLGCKNCFRSGACPQDSADGMDGLREKIRGCDALVAATPVYTIMVSGWCKNFLDRCASYCHVFELAGKPCLVMSVTGATGAERAADYLSEIMESMGCAVAGQLALRRTGEGTVIGSAAADEAAERAVAALMDAAANPEKYISERAERQFAGVRAFCRQSEVLMLLSGEPCPWEVSSFRERGYLDCTSLKEALKVGGKAHE